MCAYGAVPRYIRICNAGRHRIVMMGWVGVGESGCKGQAWSVGDDAERDAEG